MGIFETKHREYFDKHFLAHEMAMNESHEALILAVFNAGFDPVFPDDDNAVQIMISDYKIREFSDFWQDEINQFCADYLPDYGADSADYCQAAFSMVASGVRFLFERHSFLTLARKQHKYNKGI